MKTFRIMRGVVPTAAKLIHKLSDEFTEKNEIEQVQVSPIEDGHRGRDYSTGVVRLCEIYFRLVAARQLSSDIGLTPEDQLYSLTEILDECIDTYTPQLTSGVPERLYSMMYDEQREIANSDRKIPWSKVSKEQREARKTANAEAKAIKKAEVARARKLRAYSNATEKHNKLARALGIPTVSEFALDVAVKQGILVEPERDDWGVSLNALRKLEPTVAPQTSQTPATTKTPEPTPATVPAAPQPLPTTVTELVEVMREAMKPAPKPKKLTKAEQEAVDNADQLPTAVDRGLSLRSLDRLPDDVPRTHTGYPYWASDAATALKDPYGPQTLTEFFMCAPQSLVFEIPAYAGDHSIIPDSWQKTYPKLFHRLLDRAHERSFTCDEHNHKALDAKEYGWPNKFIEHDTRWRSGICKLVMRWFEEDAMTKADIYVYINKVVDWCNHDFAAARPPKQFRLLRVTPENLGYDRDTDIPEHLWPENCNDFAAVKLDHSPQTPRLGDETYDKPETKVATVSEGAIA